MSEKLLWAPWRKSYLLGIRKTKGCIFCRLLRERQDKKNLIVKRSRYSICVLNRYPYNNGHLMIVPIRHVRSFRNLSDRELIDLMRLHDNMLGLLKRRLKPDGFNLGVNVGRVGGVGVLNHIHLHLVPRWAGDTNFMPVIGKTKVISESLRSLYDRLTK